MNTTESKAARNAETPNPATTHDPEFGTSEFHDSNSTDSLKHWLTLRHTAGVGPTTFHQLLDTFGSVEAALGPMLINLANSVSNQL